MPQRPKGPGSLHRPAAHRRRQPRRAAATRPSRQGRREPYVPIVKPLASIPTGYLADTRPHCPASPYLFANPSGYPSGRDYGRTAERAGFAIAVKYATAAGLPGKHHPHRCRHGLATNLVRGKADPTTVQRMLGHSDDLVTTAR